jgi:hypothetical protein
VAGTEPTKLTNILVWTAGAAFAASWFMPVLEDVPGWMAFRYSLSPMVPYSAAAELAWEDAVPQVLSALTNVVFVILFALWVARQTMRPGLFVRIAIACVLLNLYWFVKAWREHDLNDLLIGYYLWLLAFALMLGVAIITAVAARRTSTTPTAGRPS